MVSEPLDLASDLQFPAQAGQLAFSPPSYSSPSPFMQFAASMASQGNKGEDNETASSPCLDRRPCMRILQV